MHAENFVTTSLVQLAPSATHEFAGIASARSPSMAEFSEAFQHKRVLDRKQKLRKFISGQRPAKDDDGDHGLGASGLVKRKGIRDLSSKLLHVFLDSPRKSAIKAEMIATVKNSGLEDFVDPATRH